MCRLWVCGRWSMRKRQARIVTWAKGLFWSTHGPAGEEGEKERIKKIRPKKIGKGRLEDLRRGFTDPHDGYRSMTLPDITQPLASFSFILEFFFFCNLFPFFYPPCHLFEIGRSSNFVRAMWWGSHFLFHIFSFMT